MDVKTVNDKPESEALQSDIPSDEAPSKVNGEAAETDDHAEEDGGGEEVDYKVSDGDNPAEEEMETEGINGVRAEDEDFNDLFSDYGMEESWQDVNNEDALDIGPIDIQGNFEDWMGEEECLEDAPGMEVRDLREQSEDSYNDPLFETEDGDLGKEDDMGELDPDMDCEGENIDDGQEQLEVSDESGLSEAAEREGADEGVEEEEDNLNEDCDESESLQTGQEDGTETEVQSAEVRLADLKN